jgi:hypothetical protein
VRHGAPSFSRLPVTHRAGAGRRVAGFRNRVVRGERVTEGGEARDGADDDGN